MPVIERFSRTMIERYLKSSNFQYKVDRDGDCILPVPYNDDFGCEVQVLLAATGARGEVLALTAIPAYDHPAERLADAVLACNQWNYQPWSVGETWPR